MYRTDTVHVTVSACEADSSTGVILIEYSDFHIWLCRGTQGLSPSPCLPPVSLTNWLTFAASLSSQILGFFKNIM